MFRLRFPHEDLERLAERYAYRPDDEIQTVLATRARQTGCLDKRDFLELCRWKSPRTQPRCERNPDEFVREVTRVALSTECERLRIESLTLLEGVGWPTASMILHFCHRDPYPILDYRALWSLGMELAEQPESYTFDFWWGYVQECRRLADQYKVTMRVLDRALWQYSKENQATREGA